MRPNWHQMNSDRFEKGLAAIGLGFGDIDFVMCTHLHIDHVGWNTRLDNGRWVPTFPKARYLFAERELAFWTQKEKEDPASCPGSRIPCCRSWRPSAPRWSRATTC